MFELEKGVSTTHHLIQEGITINFTDTDNTTNKGNRPKTIATSTYFRNLPLGFTILHGALFQTSLPASRTHQRRHVQGRRLE
jgi:hypothetical protein